MTVRVHLIPVVVWLSTVVCVVVLFSHRSRRYEVLGVAQGPVHQVASVSDGRLKSLNVELFDEVSQGQVLAVVDTVPENDNTRELVEAQTETVRAEIERLAAEWEATRERLLGDVAGVATSRVVDRRRFAVDVEDKRFRVLELETLIDADKLKLDNLALDAKIFVMRGRLDANDVALYELKRIQAERDDTLERIADNERLLAQARLDLAEARKRQEEFARQELQDPEMSAAKAATDKAIEVQRKRMNELQVQLAALEPLQLKAPFDGIVSVVHHNRGEAVLAGEPILTIARKEPENIVAYATEEQAARVQPRMTVQLVDRNLQRTRVVDSQVLYVGPVVEQMPPRLWRNPNIPQWGRPVVIKIPPNLDLLPGAIVGIRGI